MSNFPNAFDICRGNAGNKRLKFWDIFILNNNYFYLKRGLHQGCPISPMLLIFAVEMLAISVHQDNNISGVKVANSAFNIKMLQYADSTTLFLKKGN